MFSYKVILTLIVLSISSFTLQADEGVSYQLYSSIIKHDSPLEEDLRELVTIGARPTGSDANKKAMSWAVDKFRQMGVVVRKEAFMMPARWEERETVAHISGGLNFSPQVWAKPFSRTTVGVKAALIDGGFGTLKELQGIQNQAKGKFVLIETNPLKQLWQIGKEYRESSQVEKWAEEVGVAGVIYMSSRENNARYRHIAARAEKNTLILMIMLRKQAQRVLNHLRLGKKLSISVMLDAESSGAYQSYNVIGEIKGSSRPDEIIVLGAHLDSWDLSVGALDNGCNVVMLLDVARQIKRLGLQPKRTLRFALWNGEEQGKIGSWKYTTKHIKELDKHIMVASFDIGGGRITGFITNGREEIMQAVDKALGPLDFEDDIGPFTQQNDLVFATDNMDFLLQGVANIVALQSTVNYVEHYHADSDSYEEIDLKVLRQNTAIVATLAYEFSHIENNWQRQTRQKISNMIRENQAKKNMKAFGVWRSWLQGNRGRAELH